VTTAAELRAKLLRCGDHIVPAIDRIIERTKRDGGLTTADWAQLRTIHPDALQLHQLTMGKG
jgi:hypothetical protein